MQIKGSAATYPSAWNPLIWQFLNFRSTFPLPYRSLDEKSQYSLASLASTQIAGAGFYMMAVIK